MVTRRLCAIAGFRRYAVEEELLEHSPAAHVRRPRLDYDSPAAALDRNELGVLLVAAGLGSYGEHALISLLALTGLRVSGAAGAGIGHRGLERGHRILVITRKGGRVVAIPLAPGTARAIGLAIGERTGGPLFTTADGQRLTGTAPFGSCAALPPGAGIVEHVSPHCGTRSSPQPSPRRAIARCAGGRLAVPYRHPQVPLAAESAGEQRPGGAARRPHRARPRLPAALTAALAWHYRGWQGGWDERSAGRTPEPGAVHADHRGGPRGDGS
jgi:hypothetical protein